MPLITRTDLMRFAPHASAAIAAAIVTHADAVLPKWGINTAPRLWMLMAQISVESASLTALVENLNYSAERLVQVWPTRFATVAAAQAYAGNPQALANKVYAGRLGNAGPDDGWLNRGQGLLQVTGLDNVKQLAGTMDLSVADARAALTSDAGMLDCAAASFAAADCLRHADAGDVTGCTKTLNGGTNGIADREAAYALAKKVWPTLGTVSAAAVIPAPVIVPIPGSLRSSIASGPR
jgi:putative chitinase